MFKNTKLRMEITKTLVSNSLEIMLLKLRIVKLEKSFDKKVATQLDQFLLKELGYEQIVVSDRDFKNNPQLFTKCKFVSSLGNGDVLLVKKK